MNIPDGIKNEITLFIGAGGGFDVFAALPLSMKCQSGIFINYGQHKGFKIRQSTEEDYPEYGLAPITYTLGRNGVQDVRDGIQEIVDTYAVDTIFVIDGGVDSLMRGDEENQGTVLEDFIVMAAVDQIDVPHKYLACVGFGAETEEGLNHYRALENISALTMTGDFLGSCSLLKDSREYKAYKILCEEAWEGNRKSHIQSKIILATEGEFGDVGMDGADAQVYNQETSVNFISPLMSIYWFFNLDGVIKRNLVIEKIRESRSFTDAMMLYRQSIQPHTRPKQVIPL
jgi:hypothetical protein